MTATLILNTGVSGYIDGQLVTDTSRKHPELHFAGFARNAEQAETIRHKIPAVLIVQGDLHHTQSGHKKLKKPTSLSNQLTATK
jgi:hypothetical protein